MLRAVPIVIDGSRKRADEWRSGLTVIVPGWDGLPIPHADGVDLLPITFYPGPQYQQWVYDARIDLNNVNPPGWGAETDFWTSSTPGQGSNTLTPTGALSNSVSYGVALGNSIFLSNPNEVHLIAHSAGTNLIETAAQTLRQLGYTGLIQETFLDAYTPAASNVNFLGSNANFSDSYTYHDITETCKTG